MSRNFFVEHVLQYQHPQYRVDGHAQVSGRSALRGHITSGRSRRADMQASGNDVEVRTRRVLVIEKVSFSIYF